MTHHIICHTNLDLFNERWPDKFSGIPRVGDRIESTTVWDRGFRLQLEVVSVTWKTYSGEARPIIELHDPRKRSVKDFYEWYAPLVGKSVSSFI